MQIRRKRDKTVRGGWEQENEENIARHTNSSRMINLTPHQATIKQANQQRIYQLFAYTYDV